MDFLPLPHRFTHQDELFIRAVELGCMPINGGSCWMCRCSGATHGVSTNYTVITTASLERAKTS